MKVGDKVLVLPRVMFKHNSKYKHSYTLSMEKYAGEVLTIREKYNEEYYRLKGASEGFIWHEDWIRIEDNFLSEEEMQL